MVLGASELGEPEAGRTSFIPSPLYLPKFLFLYLAEIPWNIVKFERRARRYVIWAQVEAAMRWTMGALEKGVAERVSADWKAIRTGRSDEEFGNLFYSEIQAGRR